MTNKTVTKVEPKLGLKSLFRHYNIGIYARVSTGSTDQLHSLGTQVSAFMALYRYNPQAYIYDVYIDVLSGSNPDRPNYKRMLDDAKNGHINMVVTKSISRFGRDALETISSIRELKEFGVDVFFHSENVHSADINNSLLLTINSAVAEIENENRSLDIQAGFHASALAGTSKYYHRKCFGYVHDDNGELSINEREAAIVRYIFNTYLEGASVNQIVALLQQRAIASPTGKPTWCKRTVTELLSNEKYTGRIVLGKTVNMRGINSKRVKNIGQSVKFEMENSHPPIISEEVFASVQIEKERTTNLERTSNGVRRKETRYKSTYEHYTLDLRQEDDPSNI
jgi:DNA invertase Pin-like site-specific DNA recombinase